MATSQLAGLNYWHEGSSINFFGAKGVKLEQGRWAINAFHGLMAEVAPSSIMDEVRECIRDDVDSGDGDKIAQLQLGPRQAVVFFLEGMMTPEDLSRAIEGPAFVEIPNVQIEGRSLTVRILPSPHYTVVTADKNGDVL